MSKLLQKRKQVILKIKLVCILVLMVKQKNQENDRSEASDIPNSDIVLIWVNLTMTNVDKKMMTLPK